MTSYITAGSSPWRAPMLKASATAAIETAAIRLLTSLTVSPLPMGPTWMMVVPSTSRIGRQASSTSASPPTMIVNVPSWAFGDEPLTGASIMRSPRAVASCASARVVEGSIVLISISVPPAAMPAIAPSGPSSTACTCAEAGSIVTTYGQAWATARGLSTGRAPRAASRATGFLRDVVHDQPKARLQQVVRHREAHRAETDEADLRDARSHVARVLPASGHRGVGRIEVSGMLVRRTGASRRGAVQPAGKHRAAGGRAARRGAAAGLERRSWCERRQHLRWLHRRAVQRRQRPGRHPARRGRLGRRQVRPGLGRHRRRSGCRRRARQWRHGAGQQRHRGPEPARRGGGAGQPRVRAIRIQRQGPCRCAQPGPAHTLRLRPHASQRDLVPARDRQPHQWRCRRWRWWWWAGRRDPRRRAVVQS